MAPGKTCALAGYLASEEAQAELADLAATDPGSWTANKL
jgi:hypothetical protein